MLKKRCQAAVELIIILAVALIILSIIISFSSDTYTSVSGQFEATKARTAVDDLTDAAKLVYQQGVGSRTKIFVTLPNDIIYTNVTNNLIAIKFYAGGNERDVYRTLDFDVSGEIPAEQGNYWMYLESKSGYVSISNDIMAAVCGDDTKEGSEICDGTDLNSQTCILQGYVSGDLTCLEDCTGFNYSQCVGADLIPPATVTNLNNQSQKLTWIYWNWTNPSDADFSHTEVWINKTFYADVSAPNNYYNATGLTEDSWYEIQTRTIDTSSNINTTWVNDTAKTESALPENVTVFYDGFEGWGKNDCEHGGVWDLCDKGDGKIKRDNDEYNGTRALKFEDHDADIDYLIKCVDLGPYSNAYVAFWWKKSALGSGEYGKLDINTTGSDYVDIFDSGIGDSAYAEEVIDITSYISSNTCVKFHILADDRNDRFFVDDFRIIGES